MKNKTIKTIRHTWTKNEIKQVMRLWDNSNPDSLAKEMGVDRKQLMYIAMIIRKAGYKLASKHKKGYLHTLIREAISEMK